MITPNDDDSARGTRIPATVTPAPLSMCCGEHLPRVHAVDVVGAEHRDVVGLFVVDEVERLQDRVGAAQVPARAEPLLGGHRRDVVAEQARHPPGGGDVPVQRVRLVLREHADAQDVAVDEVGQDEVDQPVRAAEGHRRFGPVGGERHQPLALPARQHDPEHRRSTRACRRPSTLVGCPYARRWATALFEDFLVQLGPSAGPPRPSRTPAPRAPVRPRPSGAAAAGSASTESSASREARLEVLGCRRRTARAGRSRRPRRPRGCRRPREATTAVPQAIASRLTMPSGSYTEGQTNTAAWREELDHLGARQHLRDPVHAVAHRAQLLDRARGTPGRSPGCRARPRTARPAPPGRCPGRRAADAARPSGG